MSNPLQRKKNPNYWANELKDIRDVSTARSRMGTGITGISRNQQQNSFEKAKEKEIELNSEFHSLPEEISKANKLEMFDKSVQVDSAAVRAHISK